MNIRTFKKNRSVVSIMLCAAMIISSISAISFGSKELKAEGYEINNPRVVDGISTWDCIWFGSYPQRDTNYDEVYDNNDAAEPVKWRVLSVNGSDAFVMADNVLDIQKYNDSRVDVTWENCTLRKWLNEEFIYSAFSGRERAAIKTSSVVNEDNSSYGTTGGNDTKDRIYLLSLAEACNSSYGFDTIFNSVSDTWRVDGSFYVKKKAADALEYPSYSGNGNVAWWLRTPGNHNISAVVIYGDGLGVPQGYPVDTAFYAVRPVMHINLESAAWKPAGTVSSNGTKSEKAAVAADDILPVTEAVKLYAEYNDALEEMLYDVNDRELPLDVKLQITNNYCMNSGSGYYNEGVGCINDADQAQTAYNAIINDAAYASGNFGAYLSDSVEGRDAREQLYSYDMILNDETGVWKEPGTYDKDFYPGIERYKTLMLKMLSDCINESMIYARAKEVLKNVSSRIYSEDMYKNYSERLFAAESIDEQNEIIGDMIDNNLILILDGSYIPVVSDSLEKTLGMSNKSYIFAADAEGDLYEYISICAGLEIYSEYKETFDKIINSDKLPFELRAAVYYIEEELKREYLEPLEELLADIPDSSDNEADSSYEIHINKGILSGRINNHNNVMLCDYIISVLNGLDSSTKNISYTQGYAILASYYSEQLSNIRDIFLDVQTEDNAWDFYYNYIMLYNLRTEGEQSYLDMQNIKTNKNVKLPYYLLLYSYDYDVKFDIAKNNIDYLTKQCGFRIHPDTAGPPSRYSQKTIINCPVDVKVTDETGSELAHIEDGVVSDESNPYGRYVSEYKPYTGNYAKIIYMNGNNKYIYILSATGDGYVSFENYDGNMIKRISNEKVNKGDVITVDMSSGRYTIDYADTEQSDVEKELESSTDYVTLTGISLDKKSVELDENQSIRLECSIEPYNANNSYVHWISGNDNVAVVDRNGTVTGKIAGETTIYCTTSSVDAHKNMIYEECRVTVKAKEPVNPVESFSPEPSSGVEADATEEPETSAEPSAGAEPDTTAEPVPSPESETTGTPSAGETASPTDEASPVPTGTRIPGPAHAAINLIKLSNGISWYTFYGEVSYERYEPGTTVTIETSVERPAIYYYVDKSGEDRLITIEKLEGRDMWSEYRGSITLAPSRNIVYAKIEDKIRGEIYYLRSGGIDLSVAPTPEPTIVPHTEFTPEPSAESTAEATATEEPEVSATPEAEPTYSPDIEPDTSDAPEPTAVIVPTDTPEPEPVNRIVLSDGSFWSRLLKIITFGLYEPDITVSIESVYDDNVGIFYYIDNSGISRALTAEELDAIYVWTAYNGVFTLKDTYSIVYAKIIDYKEGVVSYICSDGINVKTSQTPDSVNTPVPSVQPSASPELLPTATPTAAYDTAATPTGAPTNGASGRDGTHSGTTVILSPSQEQVINNAGSGISDVGTAGAAATDAPAKNATQELKKMKISSVKCVAGAKQITGRVSVKNAVVKIKIGNKKYKKAKVKGKKFTLKLSYNLKKKQSVIIKAARKKYKSVKKKYKVS